VHIELSNVLARQQHFVQGIKVSKCTLGVSFARNWVRVQASEALNGFSYSRILLFENIFEDARR
jgi:hypothetical protein